MDAGENIQRIGSRSRRHGYQYSPTRSFQRASKEQIEAWMDLSNSENNVNDRLSGISIRRHLLKLVAVLEWTQDPVGVSNPQARQKLLQAVPRLKFTNSSFSFRQVTSKMRLLRRRILRPTSLVESCLSKNRMILFRCWKLWEIVNGTHPFFLSFLLSFSDFTLVFQSSICTVPCAKGSTYAAVRFCLAVMTERLDSSWQTCYGRIISI